eukprot:gnl/TRDRNA2_/TRDRNA2_87165_c0_seq2.p1 gnl/TRDRNA2_/TRDRNA2_87165_c0~~gnl/TRDRNA2_/TRDRNA2_87165_c0_seq2.p1  ORF type:complete len:281 (-),score=44.26 gnl/TRDRNA2_/TRDRNA2_87165_c0_seq2:259-1101(-)
MIRDSAMAGNTTRNDAHSTEEVAATLEPTGGDPSWRKRGPKPPPRWEPDPNNPYEVKLRALKDRKNKREAERHDRKRASGQWPPLEAIQREHELTGAKSLASIDESNLGNKRQGSRSRSCRSLRHGEGSDDGHLEISAVHAAGRQSALERSSRSLRWAAWAGEPEVEQEKEELNDFASAGINQESGPDVGDEEAVEQTFKEWLAALDSGKGKFLCYFDSLKREFECDFSQLEAVILPEATGPGVLGRIVPDFWEACGVVPLGHKLIIANAICALRRQAPP